MQAPIEISEPEGQSIKRSKRRWLILFMLFLVTAINYFDRQTISILAHTVRVDLEFSEQGYAHVVQLFLIGYTGAFIFVGGLIDRIGTKLSFIIFVTWWSLANMVTGLVQSAGQLGAARLALGLGESGNMAGAPKAVDENLEPKEKALAVGFFTAGAMVGAIAAPPIVTAIALIFGWRAAFIFGGLLGVIWVVAWVFVYPASPQKRVMRRSTETNWTRIFKDPMFCVLTVS